MRRRHRRPLWEQNPGVVAVRMLDRHGLEADRIASNRADRCDSNGNVAGAVFYEELVGLIQKIRGDRAERARLAAAGGCRCADCASRPDGRSR